MKPLKYIIMVLSLLIIPSFGKIVNKDTTKEEATVVIKAIQKGELDEETTVKQTQALIKFFPKLMFGLQKTFPVYAQVWFFDFNKSVNQQTLLVPAHLTVSSNPSLSSSVITNPKAATR